MTIYSKKQVLAAYERTRAADIEHDQAVWAVAQAMNQEPSDIEAVIVELQSEPEHA